MRLSSFLIVTQFSWPLAVAAQSAPSAPFQIYGAYTRQFNTYNGVPRSQQALEGWNAGVAFPDWHGLRAKVDVSHESGDNLGAQQQALSITGGGQYERTFHREGFFAEALFGDVGLNRFWGPNGQPGEMASFTTLFGGGIDTPVSRHFAIRVQGDYRYTNFALIQSTSWTAPYRIPGLPKNFASLATGLVWMPGAGSSKGRSPQTGGHRWGSVDSELMFEDLNSFGHYHVFANSWWSYLHVEGFEYDRNSWGRFIGARMDYVAEILPLVLLQQPNATDVWGNPIPRSAPHETVPGLGISPIGWRILWRDGKAWKPYYQIKGGLIGFTKKSLSQYASYLDFSLQQSVGIQFRLNDRWDFRACLNDFHFSNGFMVPSNPGIDEMAYSGAIAYKFGKRQAGE